MQLPQSGDSLRNSRVLRYSERSDSQELRTIRLARFRANRNPTQSKQTHFVAEPASVSVRDESNCSPREVVHVGDQVWSTDSNFGEVGISQFKILSSKGILVFNPPQ